MYMSSTFNLNDGTVFGIFLTKNKKRIAIDEHGHILPISCLTSADKCTFDNSKLQFKTDNFTINIDMVSKCAIYINTSGRRTKAAPTNRSEIK